MFRLAQIRTESKAVEIVVTSPDNRNYGAMEGQNPQNAASRRPKQEANEKNRWVIRSKP